MLNVEVFLEVPSTPSLGIMYYGNATFLMCQRNERQKREPLGMFYVCRCRQLFSEGETLKAISRSVIPWQCFTWTVNEAAVLSFALRNMVIYGALEAMFFRCACHTGMTT